MVFEKKKAAQLNFWLYNSATNNNDDDKGHIQSVRKSKKETPMEKGIERERESEQNLNN